MPDKALSSVRFSFNSEIRSGDNVLTVFDLEKSFPQKPLFKNFNLSIFREDKIFLLGPNGCGKSTFLKILNKELSQDSGIIKFGTNVKIGYFDQNIDKLNSDKTVLDEVWDMYKFMDQTEIRSALALFLFRGDDVFKKVSVLSGGERAKISLLKIMLSKPNFLILDEPTNHLDINSREVLEEALLNYDGTLLVVSHDRYFINKLSNKIVHLTHDGAVSIDGNYDDYLLFKENNESKKEDVKKETTKVNTYKLQKEQQALERKRNSRISKIEKEIEEKETAIAEIQDLLQLPDTSADYEKLLELTEQFDLLKNELDNLYSEWEELQE